MRGPPSHIGGTGRHEYAQRCPANTDFAHLPQAVENLADVIGLRRDGNRLDLGERTCAAGGIKELVQSLHLLSAQVRDQSGGRLLTGTGAPRASGTLDR